MSEKVNRDFWIDFEQEGTVIEIEQPDYDRVVDSLFVRNLRVSLDLTQKVFSRVLGVSKKTIEKWEQGVNPVKGPSARLLYLISENHNLVNDLYRVNIVDNFSLDSNEYYSIKQVTPLISETSNMMYKVSTKEENYDKSHDTDNFIVEGGIPCQQSSNHQLLSS